MESEHETKVDETTEVNEKFLEESPEIAEEKPSKEEPVPEKKEKKPLVKDDLNKTRLTVGIHVIAALIVGTLSPMIGYDWYAGLMGIAVLFLIGYVSQIFSGKRGIKWWFANGIIIYMFVWLMAWVYFVNI